MKTVPSPIENPNFALEKLVIAHITSQQSAPIVTL